MCIEVRAHPSIFHAEAQRELESGQSMTRWSDAEIREMANEEAEVIPTGPENKKSINQILLAKIPGRTIESIKGKRRNADYKRLVSNIVGALAPRRSGPNTHSPSTLLTPVVRALSEGHSFTPPSLMVGWVFPACAG